ncbi:hypothetical protein WJX73_000410 [Symbiochloris irregularis]|uniref:Uncharacterized protein n=1 Tax=Symbiochloris irregularis TaxID=706552 RepID=A0AAW1NXB5_9CHLO
MGVSEVIAAVRAERQSSNAEAGPVMTVAGLDNAACRLQGAAENGAEEDSNKEPNPELDVHSAREALFSIQEGSELGEAQRSAEAQDTDGQQTPRLDSRSSWSSDNGWCLYAK